MPEALVKVPTERLAPEQRVKDELTALCELTKIPEGNIIKTPNISASVPQLVECSAELQAKGYNLPDYPASPKNAEEVAIKATYSKMLLPADGATKVLK